MKRPQKLKIIIALLVLVGLAIGAYFTYTKVLPYLGRGEQKYNYAQKFKEVFDDSENALLGVNMFSAIFEPEEKEREGKRLEEYFKKKCSQLSRCPINIILDYLRIKRWLNPDYDESLEDEDLKSSIHNQYTRWKIEILLSDRDLSIKDLPYFLVMKYTGFLSKEEENSWIERIANIVSSSLESAGVNTIVLRIALDVHSVNDLRDRTGVDFERVKSVLCDNIEEATDSLVTSSNVAEKVWFYAFRKRFCKINLTENDQKFIEIITSARHFSATRTKRVSFFREYIEYLLVNINKIF